MTMLAHSSQTYSHQNCENYTAVVYKLPNLWGFFVCFVLFLYSSLNELRQIVAYPKATKIFCFLVKFLVLGFTTFRSMIYFLVIFLITKHLILKSLIFTLAPLLKNQLAKYAWVYT